MSRGDKIAFGILAGMYSWVFCFGMMGVLVGQAIATSNHWDAAQGMLCGAISSAVVCMVGIPTIMGLCHKD